MHDIVLDALDDPLNEGDQDLMLVIIAAYHEERLIAAFLHIDDMPEEPFGIVEDCTADKVMTLYRKQGRRFVCLYEEMASDELFCDIDRIHFLEHDLRARKPCHRHRREVQGARHIDARGDHEERHAFITEKGKVDARFHGQPSLCSMLTAYRCDIKP